MIIVEFIYKRTKHIKNYVRKHRLLKRYKNKLFLPDKFFLEKDVDIISEGMMRIGKNCCIKKGTSLTVRRGGACTIGKSVFFNRNCILTCRKEIVIQDNVMIGPNVIFWDNDHSFDEKQVLDNEYKTGEILIEEGCWIGSGSIILRNTKIGKGSVIGAGCVIKGNIPAHSLVTMNRELFIKPIKQR